MKDYRPISCCNVIYKVISKIIANRLKLVLPKFIAGNQSAFVKDRLLIENVLLATELVKDYHKNSISSRCALKIDISKAFDSNLAPAKLKWRGKQSANRNKEGGLGLRSLKEANDVCCLKLIWQILSHGDSLWVKWIETNLLKNNSF
ncbi:putative reverse transcriptase domain-containing protein [Arabidopsis thaliana]